MSPFPSVAVVILNWNGRQFLEQFLPSVLATIYPALTVIVADNASTDDSVPFLQQHFPQVHIIRLMHNYGFAQGYNEALKHVQQDYYILLNSDVAVEPQWLQPMIQLLEKDERAGACVPKILAHNARHLFEYAGAAGGWIDTLGYPFARGRVFDTCEEDKGQYNDTTEVFWASGAALVIKKKLFWALEGFDAFFFAHQEEIDLCWRAQLMGYKIYCSPQSVVYHVGGGTLPQGNPRKTFLNFRNNLIMLAKNLPLSEAWWKLPVRMALDQISGLKEALSGNSRYFVAVLKAHLHFIRWALFYRCKKRSEKTKPLHRLSGVYTGSIVLDYFISGRKTFSAIAKEE